jgi:glycosyltransferase involved in cell wall biosynthesis
MGMGIPVICNDIGDTGNIIAATATGLVVKSFSDDAYMEVVEKIPSLLALPKEAIRKAAFDYFDLEKGAESYEQLYKKIINRINHA